MKLAMLLIIFFALIATAAAQWRVEFVMMFDEDCPDSYIESAKEAVLSRGGDIEYDFTIIRGFSAFLSHDDIKAIQDEFKDYGATVDLGMKDPPHALDDPTLVEVLAPAEVSKY